MSSVSGFGPSAPFEALIDDDSRHGKALSPPFREWLGVDWNIPSATDVPYVYVNFVTSRDGRISFAMPGHMGGGDVSRWCANDRWLMALSRARADAVMVGDGTVKAEPEHLWTSDFIWPEGPGAFDQVRADEDRDPESTTVILSLEGDLPSDALVFQSSGSVIVLTTAVGQKAARLALAGVRAEVEVLAFDGERGVDLNAGLRELRARGVQSLLCEGGPRVYGSMLNAGLVDDELLCLSPAVVGSTAAQRRPSLVEGVAFGPDNPPQSRIVSLARSGEHLFMRSRYR